MRIVPKLVLVTFAVALCIPGIGLGVARTRRDRIEARAWHLAGTRPSPDGRNNALLYRRTPETSAKTFLQVVTLDPRANIRVEEVWERMKTSKTVLILESPTAREIAMSWSGDKQLQLECPECDSDDLLQQSPELRGVSVKLISFPTDRDHTRTQSAEVGR